MIDTLYKDIIDLRPKLEGWASIHKGLTLASMVVALRPEVCVEIGVFGGASFLPMAMAMKAIGKGVCVGIDPWASTASVVGMDEVNAKWWGQVNHDAIYWGFKDQVKALNLEEHVEIQRTTSDNAKVPENIGILSIDGNHGEQVLRDVRRFCPQVIPGGLVILDDIHWSSGCVKDAAAEMVKWRKTDHSISKDFIELYRYTDDETGENWGVLQKR